VRIVFKNLTEASRKEAIRAVPPPQTNIFIIPNNLKIMSNRKKLLLKEDSC
jgi:hypothetical protein